jgi:hypothetical protein
MFYRLIAKRQTLIYNITLVYKILKLASSGVGCVGILFCRRMPLASRTFSSHWDKPLYLERSVEGINEVDEPFETNTDQVVQ